MTPADEPTNEQLLEWIGWQPTCAHAAETEPCLVLDPFAGLATTGLAALKQGRRFVGIELNEWYIKMAHERAARIYPLLAQREPPRNRPDEWMARLGAQDLLHEEALEAEERAREAGG